MQQLELKGLTKRFGEKTLFENLTLTVAEPTVLWAPSGWGKTTLLRILMGLETSDSGTVSGVGRVGAVFQEDRLCAHLTAVQNVELVLENPDRSVIEADFRLLGFDDAALRLPAGRLSGGQKRRATLLRALWADSDTLLLDEPFTGMDPDTLAKAVGLLRSRCKGKPVLLAAHDQTAIRLLGWPVCCLADAGRPSQSKPDPQ